MAETIGYDDVVRMLHGAAAKIRENHELLSKLDSATGDGDHGTSMVKAADAIEKGAAEDSQGKLPGMLHNVGWAVMSVDGGSTGPLFGSFFMGLSEGAGDSGSLDGVAVAAMFEAGLAKVQKQTKAQVGDKTMMDALVPAVETIRASVDAAEPIDAALRQAAGAATLGAESTAPLQAKFGRARNLGDRTVGHVDPGATSVSLLFQGFAAGITAR